MNTSYKIRNGIFMILIVIFIITILLFFFRHRLPISNSEPFGNIWTPKKLEKITSLLERTQKCFQELNIDFIPMYGSLLGIIRHNSFIPWDDDYDICVHKKYFETILKNQKLFDKHGLKVVVKKALFENNFLKIFDKNEPLIPDFYWAWPFIDVFAYKIKDENFILENNAITKPNYIFKIDNFFPLQKKIIMTDNTKIEVKIPHNSEKILNSLYGNNWKEMCYSSGYNHQLERSFHKVYKKKCSEINFDLLK